MSLRVRKPKKIITFLGAGASAPFRYPTTKSFLERLGENIAGDEKAYFNSFRSLSRVKDIEQVVEILDSLLEAEDFTRKSGLSSFFEEYPRYMNFKKEKIEKFFFPRLEKVIPWKRLIILTRKLRDVIEEFTFRQYESKVAQYRRVKQEYDRLFSVLRTHKKNKQTFETFTTNYDNVIEDYCSRAGTSCFLSVLDREVNPTRKRIEKHILTKLHGSLNWLIDKETGEIEVTNTQVRVGKGSSRWDGNEYVLFGRKVRLGIAGIYDKLFDRLAKSLLETEVCVVIGFSFRDEHVSIIFKRALLENKSLRVLIVSHSPKGTAKILIPKKRQLERFIKDRRIIPLRCSFGTKRAINEINEALFSF